MVVKSALQYLTEIKMILNSNKPVSDVWKELQEKMHEIDSQFNLGKFHSDDNTFAVKEKDDVEKQLEIAEKHLDKAHETIEDLREAICLITKHM